MIITAKQVSNLRKISGAGIMDCKKALQQANGNVEEAIVILRKQGKKLALKISQRETSEGRVFIYVNPSNTEAIGFALNCESEPVSKIDEFIELGNSIAKKAIQSKTNTLQQLLSSSFSETNSIEEEILELSSKTREKITISDYHYAKSGRIDYYLHGNHIGALVSIEKIDTTYIPETGQNIAMQIAAMNPIAISKEEISEDVIKKEREIGLTKAIEQGKNKIISEKIADGFVKKFIQENTLLSQQFIKNNKLNVQQYLSQQSNITIKSFKRISIK